ncbi:hypothetical protein SAMN05421505_12470 [Sinosporangium album]|uniref:Uncharacterized protein n=1 Tax=Sinosporangium album TaxID=504805 RepID=A0A1G8FSR7_9ACTN|nr:hypothetical protein SAMN05421505_12470 [Sinosporangium album]
MVFSSFTPGDDPRTPGPGGSAPRTPRACGRGPGMVAGGHGWESTRGPGAEIRESARGLGQGLGIGGLGWGWALGAVCGGGGSTGPANTPARSGAGRRGRSTSRESPDSAFSRSGVARPVLFPFGSRPTGPVSIRESPDRSCFHSGVARPVLFLFGSRPAWECEGAPVLGLRSVGSVATRATRESTGLRAPSPRAGGAQ